jgi:hypothetical protein
MPDWSVKGAIFAPIERADITIGSFLDAAESNISVLLRHEIQEILTITKRASADASTRTLEVLKRRQQPLYRLSENPLDAFRAWLREPKQSEM